VQVIQIVTLFVLPPLAGLITIIAIASMSGSGELHRRAARVHVAGMVFVATLLSAFALLFVFSIVLSCWVLRRTPGLIA
jgi:hypothetical protein